MEISPKDLPLAELMPGCLGRGGISDEEKLRQLRSLMG